MSRDPIVMAPVTLNLGMWGSVVSVAVFMVPSWVPPQGPLRLYGDGQRDSRLIGQEFSSPKGDGLIKDQTHRRIRKRNYLVLEHTNFYYLRMVYQTSSTSLYVVH